MHLFAALAASSDSDPVPWYPTLQIGINVLLSRQILASEHLKAVTVALFKQACWTCEYVSSSSNLLRLMRQLDCRVAHLPETLPTQS